jgi:hypothetical protein
MNCLPFNSGGVCWLGPLVAQSITANTSTGMKHESRFMVGLLVWVVSLSALRQIQSENAVPLGLTLAVS